MQNRNEIKWAPFNSVMNSKIILNNIQKENDIVIKPILSEDQQNYLNDKIFEVYTNHIKIYLYIYKNQKIIKINGFINNIDIYKKHITFNKTYIYFNQIIKIENFY